MIVGRIKGATRVLGKSQDYVPLPVRDVILSDGSPAMFSAWQFMPDEIKKIQEGASLYIQILGTVHPPILPYVGNHTRANVPLPLLEAANKAIVTADGFQFENDSDRNLFVQRALQFILDIVQ